MSGEHGCARCAAYAAEIARMRKLFDDAGQEAAEKRAAERKRIAEEAAENDRLRRLMTLDRLALARERERCAKLAAENGQLIGRLNEQSAAETERRRVLAAVADAIEEASSTDMYDGTYAGRANSRAVDAVLSELRAGRVPGGEK